MKPAPFRYLRPATVGEVLAVLAGEGGEAQVLAGGQSLMPALNLRLSRPAALVDINPVVALDGVERRGDSVRIGALVRHSTVMRSPLIAQHVPLIAAAMPHIAHPAVRNRGTFGGSIALADPAAELPACCVALGAEIVLASVRGERRVAAEQFFRGLYETDREPDELITEVLVPIARPGETFAFDEIARRHGDFALVGIALRAKRRGDRLETLRMVAFGSETHPRLSTAAAAAAPARLNSDGVAALADAFATGLSPLDSMHGGAAFKRHLAGVLARRLLQGLAR
jgi:carbon-monoxide dehydrogenase medium subunit